MIRRLACGFVLLAAACTEQVTAPGDCPSFCPGGQIVIKDSIFTAIIERDSAFRGYLQSYQAEAMTAAELPAVQSRALFVLSAMITRFAPTAGDTTTVPIVVDSSRLRVVMVRRNRATTNLWVNVHLIPKTTDSTTSFSALDPNFAAPPIDSVNIDDLLSQPLITDTATVRIWGDTIQVDSAGHVLITADSARILTLFFELDTLQAPFVPADSGRLGFGIRVTADSLPSATFATTESGGSGPSMRWFYHYTVPDTVPDSIDTTPDSVAFADRTVGPGFDSFVFDPPSLPLDDNLTVGGVPSARSLLRVNVPEFLRDSFDIVRATLILVPAAAAVGSPADSFRVEAHPVQTDLGAKSPVNLAIGGFVFIRPGSSDTVRMELTNLLRVWSVDTTLATAFVLGQVPEAISFGEIRFYSSRTPLFRPALHLTYVKRFPFGEP